MEGGAMWGLGGKRQAEMAAAARVEGIKQGEAQLLARLQDEQKRQQEEQAQQGVTLRLGMGINIGGIPFAVKDFHRGGEVVLAVDRRNLKHSLQMRGNMLHFVPNVPAPTKPAVADEPLRNGYSQVLGETAEEKQQ